MGGHHWGLGLEYGVSLQHSTKWHCIELVCAISYSFRAKILVHKQSQEDKKTKQTVIIFLGTESS